MTRFGMAALILVGQTNADLLRGSWLEISVGSSKFSVKDYGAKGDGKSDDTKAIQSALDAAATAQGGTVDFPPGNYLTTAFHFSGSNTVIHLPVDARVTFDNDQSKYDDKHHLIEVNGLSNIGIVGGGVFDGQGPNWWACRASGCYRPRMLSTSHTDHLLIMDCVFKDSPNHVLELYSDFTELSGVSVLAPPSTSDKIPVNGTYGPSHNTDAVDVHGTPFYIHDCHFDTGDDNVAVHASDLLVENSYFGHGHGASIGSCGSDTALQNITFRNIVFNKTGQAAKIKTHAGATNSYVRDVVWENLVLYDVEQSIQIDMFYDHGKNETTDFKISNITIRNVTAYGTRTEEGKQVTPGIFHCQESSPCVDIHLQDIRHVNSKEPFDCYNAFGDWTNVSPKPCFGDSPSPSPPSCDVDGCFARCISKYGGTIETDAYSCGKGCSGMSEGKVTNKDKFCSYAENERFEKCTSSCSGASSSADKVKMCEYGCEFWQVQAQFDTLMV